MAYAAQIACQLGAHVVKVKPPTAHIEQAEAKKVYEKEKIPVGTLAERVRHVVQSAFDGRRIVIFSGGPAKGTAEILEEVQGHRATAAPSARSWAATRSSARRPRRSSCSTT